MKKRATKIDNATDHLTKADVFLLFIAFFIFALNLISTFKVPYIGDDKINNLVNGALLYNNRSIWTHTGSIAEVWIQGGRFFPLGFYSYALFHILPGLMSYRIFILLLNIIAATVFSLLVHQISRSYKCTAFSIALLTVFFQYKDYHDAILGYHGLLQLVSIFFFCALIFQLIAIRKKKLAYNIFSGVFFLISLFMYEVSYSFIIVFLIVVLLYEKGKKRIIYSLPQLSALVIAMIPTIILRARAVESYNGIEFSFIPASIIKTFVKQFTATLPLSYTLSISDQIIPAFENFRIIIYPYQFVLLVVFFMFLAFICWEFRSDVKGKKCHEKPDRKNKLDKMTTIPDSLDPIKCEDEEWNHNFEKKLFFIGLGISCAPALILSLSSRYQKDLQWGVGYLPVYVQYFGGVCVTVALFFLFFRRRRDGWMKKIGKICIPVCTTIVFFFNILSNQITIQQIIGKTIQPVASYAVQEGLLDELPENARFLVVHGDIGPESEPANFVAKYTNGRMIDPVKISELIEGYEGIVDQNEEICTIYPENIYGFTAWGKLENGLASVFKIDSLEYRREEKNIVQVFTKELKCMYIGENSNTEIYIPRLDENGAMAACSVDIEDLILQDEVTQAWRDDGEAISLYQEGLFQMLIAKTGGLKEPPSGLKRWLNLDQGYSFSFFIKSENYPILTRSVVVESTEEFKK